MDIQKIRKQCKAAFFEVAYNWGIIPFCYLDEAGYWIEVTPKQQIIVKHSD